MTADARIPWLRLARCRPLSSGLARRLLSHFGDAATLFDAGPGAWRRQGVQAPQLAALTAAADLPVEADLDWLAGGADRHLLALNDPRYPQRLREIEDAPAVLFARGDPELLSLPQLAVVGSRAATPQGRENAHAFSEALAARGLTITSGLAEGVDGAAHEGALAAGGLTIAVCATGLDQVYPARHRSLAHRIAGEGVLVSEFPLGVGPLAHHFPRRNRIISGLSLGVLVVEAAAGSGSLITARLGAEQGREVFAIPGSIHNPQARGCHRLIRQGAKLVESVDDVLEELGPQIGPALRAAQGGGALSARAADTTELEQALGDEALAFDALLARVGGRSQDLSSALLSLELAGRVRREADGRYRGTPDRG